MYQLRSRVVGALCAAGCLLIALPAAADGYNGGYSPRLTPTAWTGFYVGAHAGYGFDDWNVDLSHSSGAIHYNDPFANPFQSLNSSDGWLGGLQAGANYQLGKIVVGLETDVSWTDLDAQGRFTTQAPNFATWDIDASLELFGTVRGRLGVAMDHLLIYGTAGMAWGVVDAKQATNWFAPAPPDVGGRTSGETNHIGWTIGGGAEWMLAHSWSVKADYLYVDLGKENYSLYGTTKPGGNVPYVETFATDLNFNVIRVGLNYKFGARDEPIVPLK